MSAAPTITTAMPSTIPAIYRLVFLWVEPTSIFVGAVYAHSLQPTYLRLTHAASAPRNNNAVPLSTSIVMSQLANLYLGLAILEASVLRATQDVQVWHRFLIALLLADFGHLYSVWPLGSSIYWQYWRWNAIDYGNIPFVYFLAVTRVLMLLGVGCRTSKVPRRLKST